MYDVLQGLSGFDAVAGAAQTVLPVGVGAAVSFGAAMAIEKFTSSVTMKRWKWAIAAGAAVVVGGLLWTVRSKTDGALCMGGGALTSAAGFGIEKLMGAGKVTTEGMHGRYVTGRSEPLLAGRYVTQEPQPILAGFGAGGVPSIPTAEVVNLGAMNPGIFVG